MKLKNQCVIGIVCALAGVSAYAADVGLPVIGDQAVKAQAEQQLVDTAVAQSTMIMSKKVQVSGFLSKVGRVPAEDVTRVFTIGERSNAMLTFGDVNQVSKNLEARWYHCDRVVTAYPYTLKPANTPHHVWFWVNTQQLGVGPAAVEVRERDSNRVIARTDFDVRDAQGNSASCGQPMKRIALSADALFAFGRAGLSDVTPKGQAQLSEVVTQLNTAYSKVNQIVVTGYTDSIGSDAANLALSQARAQSIGQFLIAHGVPAQLIRTEGRGESETLTQCDEKMPRAALIACKQPDRRVTLDIDGVQRNLPAQ